MLVHAVLNSSIVNELESGLMEYASFTYAIVTGKSSSADEGVLSFTGRS